MEFDNIFICLAKVNCANYFVFEILRHCTDFSRTFFVLLLLIITDFAFKTPCKKLENLSMYSFSHKSNAKGFRLKSLLHSEISTFLINIQAKYDLFKSRLLFQKNTHFTAKSLKNVVGSRSQYFQIIVFKQTKTKGKIFKAPFC